MPALPRIVRQQSCASDQIRERRSVGCRGLGALARDQVEFGQLLAFLSSGDQGDPTVELVDDLEDGLLALLCGGVRHEQPAYSQMGFGAQLFRDQ
jgi:hypothetical protein